MIGRICSLLSESSGEVVTAPLPSISLTFHLPDLRGRFLRGVDGGVGRDPDRASRSASNPGGASGDAVGSVQLDQFQDHLHQFSAYQRTGSSDEVDTANSNFTVVARNTTGAVTGRTGDETRPVNANVLYIIKG